MPDGRDGLLQEGSDGSARYTSSHRRATVLRIKLLAGRDYPFQRKFNFIAASVYFRASRER